jgi:hypothetical protein
METTSYWGGVGAGRGGGGSKKTFREHMIWESQNSDHIQTAKKSIRLASHFLIAPNSLSGGCEFESSASTITQHSDNIEDL